MKQDLNRYSCAWVWPTPEEIVEFCNGLNSINKFEVWWHYYYKMLVLKHNFNVVDELPITNPTTHYGRELLKKGILTPEPMIGHGKPDKRFNSLSCRIYYYHKDLYIKPYEEFTDPVKNIRTIDNGEDWQERGFAQKIRSDYFGIYEWYMKFRSEITLTKI